MKTDIHLEVQGRHLILLLDRPPLNILDLATIADLDQAIEDTGAHNPQLVTIRSADPKTFSAGVSIQDHAPDKIDTMLDGFHTALARLRDLTAITIAEVRGRCLGGGMELAMACDIVLASESSRFAQPEIELGCFPPYAAALYPRRIGSDRALLLLATGRSIDGRSAERWGLATECHADDEFEARAAELAESLLAKSSAVIRLTKKAVRASAARAFDEALAESERIYRDELGPSQDLREGIEAFLEKRPPNWRHR